MTGLWLDGIPRPDHGPGMQQRVCPDCKAGWVGLVDDPCGWCVDAVERQLADERRLLLNPPWLRSSAGDPRYDELSDIDKAVWDATRGQTRGVDSVKAWTARLARGVETGLITEHEARAAAKRVKGK